MNLLVFNILLSIVLKLTVVVSNFNLIDLLCFINLKMKELCRLKNSL